MQKATTVACVMKKGEHSYTRAHLWFRRFLPTTGSVLLVFAALVLAASMAPTHGRVRRMSERY